MTNTPPPAYLARHGETAWTVTGQHTGLTDLPLTPRGQQNARRLGQRLQTIPFAHVLTSPLQRAQQTCQLAGFSDLAQVDPDLVEWNYGSFEGKTTPEILRENPDWELFRDGCPNGESPAQVAQRADRVIHKIRTLDNPHNQPILLFSSGHFLRILATRWLNLQPQQGRHFLLGTAALSILGYDHTPDQPAIDLWNDRNHVSEA